MSAGLLTPTEQTLLAAFDGAYSTWTSLSRNSGLDANALEGALERLLAAELVEHVRPELFQGVAVNGYVLTTDGLALAKATNPTNL